MTEHHFISNSFFESLKTNNPQNEFADANDLIETIQSVEIDTQKFHKKNYNTLIILGVFMLIISLIILLSKELGTILLILATAISIPSLFQILTHQPDNAIKKKIQKFQKSLSKGLKKPYTKILARSKTDRIISGVFGGIGQYLGIPPWTLRIIAISLLFASGGIVLIFYIAFAASLPEEQSLPELED